MMIKKYILGFFLLSIITSSMQATHAIPRDTGLVIAGITLCAGGVYQFCKRAHKDLHYVTDVMSGITLFGLGIALILWSAQLVKESDISLAKGK